MEKGKQLLLEPVGWKLHPDILRRGKAMYFNLVFFPVQFSMNKMFLGLLTLVVVIALTLQLDFMCHINTVAIVIIQEALSFDLKKNSTSNQDNTDPLDYNQPSEGRTCQIPAGF